MKKYTLLIIYLICNTFCFSQSKDWIQINTPFRESVRLVYQSSEGLLFGALFTFSHKLVFSDNNGLSWKNLEGININPYYYYHSRLPFEENKINELYFFNKNKIFKFDKLNEAFKEFVILDDNDNISDISFLSNGDLVVANGNKLMLFDKAGLLKKSYEFQTTILRLLTGSEENSKHYLLKTKNHWKDQHINELWSFTPDLSKIESFTPQSHFIFARQGSRIFTPSEYTDDGGNTWYQIPFVSGDFINNIFISHNNEIYFIGNNNVYITGDGGVTFKVINKPNIDYISSVNGLLIANIKNSCSFQIEYSNDGGQTWTKIENEIGGHYAYNVHPAIDEKLFSGYCEFYQKENSNSDWVISDFNSTMIDNFYPTINHLANKNLIAYDQNSMFISKNNGNSWTFKQGGNFHSGIKEKKGRLFISSNVLHYSDDFGESWQSKTLKTQLVNPTKIDYSSNSIIYYNSTDCYSCLHRYDDLANLSTSLSFSNENERIVDFATSFEGTNLYIIMRDLLNTKLKFYVSHDGGFIFSPITLELTDVEANKFRIYTDRLGNVYVYSDSKVFFSSDGGETWSNISPDFDFGPFETFIINDLRVSYDNHIYLSSKGKGILKYMAHLPTSVQSNSAGDIKFSPNPTHGIINIKFNHLVNKGFEISIYNLNGENVFKQNFNTSDIELNISHLPSSIYFLHYFDGDQRFVSKLFKN